jgi:hypothetical protein
VLARILAAALFVLIPSIAFGQCSGNFPANTLCGTVTGGVPRAIAAPLSVSNTDSSLMIAPTTGSVIASLNPGHSNSWSATQTFSNVIDTNLVSGGTQCVQATAAGLLVGTGAVCGSGGGGGGVTSVNNSDGSLTVVSPTGPAVTVSLNPSHANTWTAVQSITNGDLSLLGATSGNTLLEASAVAGAGTIATFPANTGIVAELNLAQTWTALQTFGSITSVTTNKWFSNDTPAVKELRWGDRVFAGDVATNYTNTNACPTGDWFTNFEATTSNGACAYIGSFQSVIESHASNTNATAGLLGTGQTKLNNSNGAFGLMGFALNNNASSAGGAFAGYFECDQTTSNSSGCFGLELDVGNFVSNGFPGSPDAYQQTGINTLQLACGSGLSSPATFQCGTAMQIVPNTKSFKVGISFLNGSVVTTTVGGLTVNPAIVMPLNYGFIWYSAAATPQLGLVGDGVGNLRIQQNGTIVVNGNGGVSCPAGTVNGATVAFVNGIATHC